MAEFYRFPHGILTMLVMAVALCIVLQALNISYSIRRLRAGWARIAENGMECAVLAVLFLFCSSPGPGTVRAVRQFYGGQLLCLCPSGRISAGGGAGDFRRCGNRVDLAIFRSGRGCCVTSHNREDCWACLSPLFPGQSSVFPAPQRTYLPAAPAGAPYPNLLYLIKEAIDSLDTGLLFLRPKGEILLCNRRMEMLAQKMIGHPLHSGREFQQILEDGSAEWWMCP